MRTVIYADVLVIVNLLVNYFLLRAAAALTGGQARPARALAAAALGGVYALVIFLDPLPAWLLAGMELTFAAVLVLIAFGFCERRLFLKRCAAFLLANAFFAGCMLAVSRFLAPQGMICRNGVTYFEIDLLTLTLLTVGCYLVLMLAGRFLRGGAPPAVVFSLTVELNGRSVTGKALLDTGNTLRDGFSARPVLIAERSFLQPLLPADGALEGLRGFRCIPFTTVGGSGILPAFTADRAVLGARENITIITQPVIAVTEQRMIAAGYAALFGPAFAEEGRRGRKKGADNDVKEFAQPVADADCAAEDGTLRRAGRLHQRAGYAAAAAAAGGGAGLPREAGAGGSGGAGCADRA